MTIRGEKKNEKSGMTETFNPIRQSEEAHGEMCWKTDLTAIHNFSTSPNQPNTTQLEEI